MIKAIFLAAGQSKRLKSENKLTKLYKKTPLINHSLKALQKSKVNKVIIVLGHEHKKVKRIIKKNKKNIFIYNKNYRKGMASSIKVGLRKFYISVHYLSDQIINYFGNGEKWDISISYLHEERNQWALQVP